MMCFGGRRWEEQGISLDFLNITCDHRSKEKKPVSNSEVKAELAIAEE